jgi:transposase
MSLFIARNEGCNAIDKVNKLLPGTKYVSHSIEDGVLTVILESVQNLNLCPYCGTESTRIHSYHIRKFSELPIDGHIVNVRLYNKKFFCVNKSCNHTTFSENFDFIRPLEMKTNRLIDKILEISENSSMRKSAIMLKELGVVTCKATICNLKNKH